LRRLTIFTPLRLFTAVLAVTLPLFAQQNVFVPPAEIIIVHAKVFTADTHNPSADAIAIHKGKIQAVGKEIEIERYRGIGTRVIDAGGKLVFPGFIDCHVHFLRGSLSLGRVNLEGAKDVTEIQQRLKDYAAKHPDTDWILGGGWSYAMFGADGLPDKKYLDKLFPNRPVYLDGYDQHTFWANSKALALAGISRSTLSPPNGTIVHDKFTGNPTGVLQEEADTLIRKVIPEPTEIEKVRALRAGIKWANRNGLTRVQSARWDFEILPLLDQIREDKQLTLRFDLAYLPAESQFTDKDLATIEAAHKKHHDDYINVNAVKLVLDGVVETRTAAFLEPYADEPATKGSLFWDVNKYKDTVALLDKKGFQVYTHAIGDYAVRTALDAYEEAEKRNHSKNKRHRIEHVETVATSDISRFGKLGVIASMQPLHAYPDSDTLDVWAIRVGPERAKLAWAWKSIADAGGKYAFGSDWPIVTLNPFEGIQTAVTRQTSDATPKDGFDAGERLTVADAIEGYTIDAAFAGHHEKTEGSIMVGKAADLIIVDRNIFEVDAHTIGKTKVVFTIVGGKIVYEADAK